MRLCAVSIDLDEIHHYYGIHGLGAPPADVAHVAYDVALGRCLELFAELEVPLTLFAVATDLARVENVQQLAAAAERGHEIASHSLDHLYDLVSRPRQEQRLQIVGACDVFEQKLGHRPAGFRAPGYLVSDQLLTEVQAAGHRYDSSVFPCPPYYLAKLAAIAAHRLAGRRSRSVVDGPAVLSSPTRPYRVGRPYTRPGAGLLEFPVQVTRGPRLPFIGTALTMAGRLGAMALTELVVGEPLVNLELHAIDLLDSRDGLEPLAGHQRDLRVGVENKRRTFSAVVARLRKAGYRFVRLADACDLYEDEDMPTRASRVS